MAIMTIPVPERPKEGVRYESDGKLLAILIETDLENIAAFAGCQPLSHYAVDAGSFEEYDPSAHFEEKFYSVVDGLDFVRTIRKVIMRNPKLVKYERTNPDEVLKELALLEEWLLAQGEENRFYLALA